MSKTAIAFLTCDRLELVERSIQPLLDGARKQQYDLFVVDGSTGEANQKAIWKLAYPTATIEQDIRGGAGAAIVFALTTLLNHPENYDYVGLCEADVLLYEGWFGETHGLFERGRLEDLDVGAVSARCYEDRVLFQRQGYAVCHNLGAGQIIFTRQAARIVLDTFRTAWSTDNRRVFAQLCGVDIGTYWAFRTNAHYLTADFHWEVALAAQGLAALAVAPSQVEMIGQTPPLAEQGLRIVRKGHFSERLNDRAFSRFATDTARIRDGIFQLGVETRFHHDPITGTHTYFPHQMQMLGGRYEGDWRLKEARGWGTFAWVSGEAECDTESSGTDRFAIPLSARLIVPAFGDVAVLVSGGKTGGKIEVVDKSSGFRAAPDLPPEGDQTSVLQMLVPGAMNYRTLRITALTPGIVFYGLQTREPQPSLPHGAFDYSVLPPV